MNQTKRDSLVRGPAARAVIHESRFAGYAQR
jgi:hypothetical protein